MRGILREALSAPTAWYSHKASPNSMGELLRFCSDCATSMGLRYTITPTGASIYCRHAGNSRHRRGSLSTHGRNASISITSDLTDWPRAGVTARMSLKTHSLRLNHVQLRDWRILL